MIDLYVFFLTVVIPVAIKYLWVETYVETDVCFGLYGKPNEHTVPIINIINKYHIPTMVAVEKGDLESYPFALQTYLNKSSLYKFVPYINDIRDMDAMYQLNTSMVLSPYKFNIPNRTVVVPNYYKTLLKDYDDNMNLIAKVWKDVRDAKINGYMLFPYTKSTLSIIEEMIHDIARFKRTINTRWYSM